MNRIGSVSCPRLSGKVSTVRLTKGASWSKNEKIRLYFLARGQMTLKAEYMIK